MSDRRQAKSLLIAISVAAAVAVPLRAGAWQIQSGFTDACHEQLTLSAIRGVAGGVFSGGQPDYVISPLFPAAGVDVDPVVVGVADEFASVIGLEFENDIVRLAALSLISGVRYPDINESSAYDFFVMRPLMLYDDFEGHHFIRKSTDDYEEGNVTAIADGRTYIREQLALAYESAALPLEQRFKVHRIAIDLYGEVDVLLYEPLFRLGVALHTFEDSFAHALRSDDLHAIVSVLNSIDAISDDFDERRDGIAHSMAMDSCMGESHDIAVVAAGAVRELIVAASQVAAGGATEDVVDGQDPVDHVFDSWLGYQPDCSMDNDYCNTIWLELARKRPFGPIIKMVLGCDARSGDGRAPGMDISAALLLSVLMLITGRAVRKGRQS